MILSGGSDAELARLMTGGELLADKIEQALALLASVHQPQIARQQEQQQEQQHEQQQEQQQPKQPEQPPPRQPQQPQQPPQQPVRQSELQVEGYEAADV